MRVRDVEIALVLAREMKAAASRSVDASLRLEQLQEVFGATTLDRAERARIQTALQMAGLEPQPSLIDADPSAPIRFGVSGPSAAAAPPPPKQRERTRGGDGATFPTVGEFARSKFRGRRGGASAGTNGASTAVDHSDDRPAAPELPATPRDFGPSADTVPGTPVVDEADFAEEEQLYEPAAEPVDDEPVLDEVPDAAVATADEDPAVEDAPEAVEHETEVEDPAGEAVEHDAPVEDAAEAEEPLVDHPDEAEAEEPVGDYAPDPEPEPAPEDERPPTYEPVPVAAAEPEPVPAPERPRFDDVVAALLPAVAIPVLVTSIAGWRFGLPFVALAVIATGWILGRRTRDDGARGGILASLRSSPVAGTILKGTVLVTVLSGVAAVLLATVGDSSSKSGGEAEKTAEPAKKPAKATADKPKADKPDETAKKPPDSSKSDRASGTGSSKGDSSSGSPTGATDQPDSGTEGLVRVPPGGDSTPSTGTGPGTGAPPTTTQPGTQTPQSGAGTPTP